MGQVNMELVGKRVLVAEDVLVIAQEIEQMLRRMGCEVVGAAPTVDAALQLVDDALDAAVIDLNLHGRPATDIIDALEAKSVPYIVVSGYDSPQIQELAGEAPRLQKPFSVRDLESAVLRLVNPAATGAAGS